MSAFESEITVRRTRFASRRAAGRWSKRSAATASRWCWSDPSVHLEERERAQIVGAWVQDSRYGMQVEGAGGQPLPPSDDDADA